MAAPPLFAEAAAPGFWTTFFFILPAALALGLLALGLLAAGLLPVAAPLAGLLAAFFARLRGPAEPPAPAAPRGRFFCCGVVLSLGLKV